MEDYNKKKPIPTTHTSAMCPTWKQLKKTLSAKFLPLYTLIFQLKAVQEKEKPFRTGMCTKEKNN